MGAAFVSVWKAPRVGRITRGEVHRRELFEVVFVFIAGVVFVVVIRRIQLFIAEIFVGVGAVVEAFAVLHLLDIAKAKRHALAAVLIVSVDSDRCKGDKGILA